MLRNRRGPVVSSFVTVQMTTARLSNTVVDSIRVRRGGLGVSEARNVSGRRTARRPAAPW